MSPSSALKDLFFPVDPAEIIDAVATETRLFRRTLRAEKFARFLPWETLNTLITPSALQSGRVVMARQGRTLPLEMVGAADRTKPGDWLAPEAIHSLCGQGLSLVLNGVEKQIPSVAAMNAMLERYLRCETITNAYASFSRDSAFKAHLDPQNVLILQLQGRKRWWCYGQVAAFPLKSMVFPTLEELPPAQWEGVLEPGDMLFVPRGDVHRAMVEDTNSLHLTVTMTPPTGADILSSLARRAVQEVSVRRYLPIHGDVAARGEHIDSLRVLFHRLVDALDIEAFLVEADLARAAASPLSLGMAQPLLPTTEVHPALRRRIPLPVANGSEISIRIGGVAITLPAAEREVLAALLAADCLTIEQLANALPEVDVRDAVAGLARKALVFLFPAS